MLSREDLEWKANVKCVECGQNVWLPATYYEGRCRRCVTNYVYVKDYEQYRRKRLWV